MPKYFTLTRAADSDLENIRDYTLNTYGQKQADAYDRLIKQAFRDLMRDAHRPGSRNRDELAAGIRSYRIELSKSSANSAVKSPRHIVFYFTAQSDTLVVSRVLHEARDHTRTMEEFRDHVMQYAAKPNTPPSAKNKRRER